MATKKQTEQTEATPKASEAATSEAKNEAFSIKTIKTLKQTEKSKTPIYLRRGMLELLEKINFSSDDIGDFNPQIELEKLIIEKGLALGLISRDEMSELEAMTFLNATIIHNFWQLDTITKNHLSRLNEGLNQIHKTLNDNVQDDYAANQKAMNTLL
jgi:hypothetical protein